MESILLIFVALGVAAAAPTDNTCSDGFLRYYSNHGANSSSTSRPPVQIVFDEIAYEPGDSVDVGIRARHREYFQGFYLEARSADEGSEPLGRWYPDSFGTKSVCNGNRGLTHSMTRNTRMVVGEWVGGSFDGDVIFVAHVVKPDGTYWEGITSEVLRQEVRAAPGANPGRGGWRGWWDDSDESSEESDEDSWEVIGW